MGETASFPAIRRTVEKTEVNKRGTWMNAVSRSRYQNYSHSHQSNYSKHPRDRRAAALQRTLQNNLDSRRTFSEKKTEKKGKTFF